MLGMHSDLDYASRRGLPSGLGLVVPSGFGYPGDSVA